MKILVLICIIGFLIIFFPQGSFTAVIELLTSGGQIFFRIVPMLLDFIGPIINAFFSTRYLISLLAFFVFANLLVVLIRFIKGQSTGFSEGVNSDDDFADEDLETDEYDYEYVTDVRSTIDLDKKREYLHNRVKTYKINKRTGRRKLDDDVNYKSSRKL